MAPTTTHRSLPRRIIRAGAGTGSMTLLSLALIGSPALADDDMDTPPEAPFEITQEVLDDSITAYDAADSITSLGDAESDEDELLVLETDILFASNAWDLPDGSADRITELASDIPDGATVQVGGHTDSRPVDSSRYDFDNQQLSEHHAQAVADALAEGRPDLTLEVEGFGDREPAVTEDPDDSSSYAANRRVELRYGE